MFYVPARNASYHNARESEKHFLMADDIRTSLNDELRLQLPNGDLIPIRETAVEYFLTMDERYDATDESDFYCPTTDAKAMHVSTGESASIDSDMVHRRQCHFSFERIRASIRRLQSARLGFICERLPGRRKEACCSCQRGAGHKQST